MSTTTEKYTLDKEHSGLCARTCNVGYIINSNAPLQHGDFFYIPFIDRAEKYDASWDYGAFHPKVMNWKKVEFATASINLDGVPVIEERSIEKEAMDLLKEDWNRLYWVGYPERPFPKDYERDLKNVMLGLSAAKKELYTENQLRTAIEKAREQHWDEGGGGLVKQGSWEFDLQYKEDIEKMMSEIKKPMFEITFENNKPVKCTLL